MQDFEKVYIGETGRNFAARMNEHKKEVEDKESQRYTHRTKLVTADLQNKPSQIMF